MYLLCILCFQDTIVALQSLSKFASQVYGQGVDATVTVIETGSQNDHTFYVNNMNSLVLQQTNINVPNQLQLATMGTGCVFMQVNRRLLL